ncbi:exosortase A [Pseudoduganella sp. UC29_106]|uniref:exosortase A n=1 Tax=Pseudoduganella sp. UC29_106 TaxID=3374553 RepID=UPI0037584891
MNTVPTIERPAADTGRATPPAPAAASPLQALLRVYGAMLLPLLAYWSTAWSIVSIWERSGTYAHGYVILPISMWLIWRRRDVLAATPSRPYWPALLALLACGGAWLVAKEGDVQIVRQYALAAMMPLCVAALLGVQVARAIAFPLAYLLFMVPVGESLVPPLMDITANFTIDALRLTGIPVLRDGNSFAIPTGNWSVVDACSGLRYLIASITLGCLYAYLTYRSPWRRLAFIVAATLVPILANGLRAYMIVMIGHMSGMTLAVGVDHIIYGWAFFGLVMLVLYWAGSFWREDNTPPSREEASRVQRLAAAAPGWRRAAAGLAVLLSIGAWPALAYRADALAPAARAVQLTPLPDDGVAFTKWEPDFTPAAAKLRVVQATSTRPVGLELQYFDGDPSGDGKLVSSANRMTRPADGFREDHITVRNETVAGHPLELRESVIDGPGQRLLVWRWYWLNGKVTQSNYVGKLLQVKGKLLNGSGDGAVVMVFSQYDENPAAARDAMREFLNKNFAVLSTTLASSQRP